MLENLDYNPDVLNCIANLSNDEVFTSPELVNDILDILPKELFQSRDTTFLDPVSKSGVFLREIAKRLMKGLENKIPDQNERINHIFKNQLFGIAITELTALLSRRSVYCSKKANGQYSVCENFENEEGNIIYTRVDHIWSKTGNCIYCGASELTYSRDLKLENYAYQFIHTDNPKELFNMKFDVIIGNPPYQLSDGGAQASAIPIYHKFIQQAKKLNPRYLTMITPSRWFSGGKGLDNFREEMLHDDRIRVICDFINANECFPGVEIKGGVNFFLWDRDNKGMCEINTFENGKLSSSSLRPLLEKDTDVFIRYNEAISIFRKVNKFNEKKFNSLISPRKPFGLATSFEGVRKNPINGDILIYANKRKGYINNNEILRNNDWVDKYKLFVPYAIGSGDSKTDHIKPILSKPGSCCTETYLVFGPFNDKSIAMNVMSYIDTKFFHFLLTLKKNTQHATSKVYDLIPQQDYSEKWSDLKLYDKYKLSKSEINFLESMILVNK